ncbi:MAG: hypothetical protein ABSC17_04580 [Thermacetogeniaceae bacterium]
MAVALRREELERFGEETGRLHLVATELGQTAGTATTQMEYPYYDLYQMYGYITKELGIK